MYFWDDTDDEGDMFHVELYNIPSQVCRDRDEAPSNLSVNKLLIIIFQTGEFL